ncbi:peptidoglycan DD-metalloendopeptidase family protein [Microcoleus sp. OTE_8_concoct_300]|uniref:peptidoglycan DD-metalloendopeptidase family protein n=1 Tax=Microcoleus sp. OTE_8_concoct_300 TaxID=2964710 RepID=UPI00403F5722
MTTPKLTINIEPVESGKAVYLPIAAMTADQKQLVKIVLRLQITNGESKTIHINAIQFSFPGSQVPAINMQAVNLDINPGNSALWSNGVVKLDNNTMASNVVYLPAPGPSKVTVSVSCSDFSSPATITIDLAPHKSPTPQGAYLFPFSASDLRVGEYFVTSAQHWANGGANGSQILAHDIGVQALNPDNNKWSDLLPGQSGTKNEDYRIWGKPVRAVADGTVEEWHDGMENNTTLGKFPDPTPNPGGGNNIWVRHGDELVFYAHFQKNTIPDALKQKGAVVKAGQMIGLAGNSGNSTNPHTHVQCLKNSTSGPLRPMPFRNAWVIDRNSFNPPNPDGPWVQLTGQGISKEAVAIWPSESKPAWYPPGWGEVAHFGIAEAQYQTIFNRVTSSGYRLIWVDGYEVNGKTFFNAIFRPADGTAWVARHGLTGVEYQKEFDTRTKEGMRLLNLSSYLSAGSIRYATIFVKANGVIWKAYHGLTAEQHQNQFNNWIAEGFRPVNVSAVSISGQRSYAAFYEKSDVGSFVVKSFLTPEQYQNEWNDNVAVGRQLAYLSAYEHLNEVRFSAIFQQKVIGSGQTVGRHHLTSAQMQDEYDKWLGQGLLTRVIAGYQRGNQHQFAAAWRKN